MKNRTVLISGAGIAGCALAQWLHLYGFTPTVVERATTLRTGGYKIDIRGAALDAVEHIGVLEQVRRASTDMRGTSFVNSAGKQVASIDADLAGGRSGTDIEIMRGDLNRILYDQTKGRVEYVFGDFVTGISQDEGGVQVAFEHGPTRTFDLVAGADGLHSSTRALVFDEQSWFIHDLGYYVAIFSIPNHLGLDRWELTYPRPGKTAQMYSTRHDSEAKAMFFFTSPPLDYDRHDLAQQQKHLASAFAGEGWEVPRLLGSMAEASDFYFDSLSQVHLDRWSNGRAVLLGDAAYGSSPASGQGTSVALVGAYVLAGELAAAAGDHHHIAFHAYEQEMRQFVEQNQALAATNINGMVMRTRWQVALQMQMLRMLPHLPGRGRIIERVTGPIRNAATAISLKDYSASRDTVQSHGDRSGCRTGEVTEAT